MSNLKSLASGIHVPSAASPTEFDDYVVPEVVDPPSEGWAIERDWNDGVLGAMAVGADGFDSEAGWSTYDNTRSHSGGQCCRCWLKKDVTVSTFKWGGRVDFPANLVEGEVLYFEAWMWFPSNFYWVQSFDPTLNYTKFLRFEKYDDAGVNRFSKIFQIRAPNLGADYRSTTTSDSSLGGADLKYGHSDTLNRGSWIRQQVEVGMGILEIDQGGNGYWKHWVDGRLQMYFSDRTLGTTSKSWGAFRLWNTFSPNASSALPHDMFMWIDDLKIYNRRPSWWPT